MSGPNDNDDLEQRLARREPLFPRLRNNDPLEPPAEIDRAVLSRARAALRVETAERRPRFFTLDQWALPLGLAASLVLGIGIFVRLYVDDQATTAATTAVAPPPAVSGSALAKAEGRERDAAAVPAEESGATEAALPAINTAGRVSATPQAPPPAPVVPAPPSPTERMQAPAVTSAPTAIAAVTDQAAADFAATDKLADEARPEVSAAGAAVQSRAAAKVMESTETVAALPDPIVWYERIVALRAAGRRREADAEWRRLRAAYPDFEAPAANAVQPLAAPSAPPP